MKKILISLFLFTIVFTQDMISSDNSREITIYKDGFATLKEPIVWNLKAGKNTTRFDNLSPNIVFDSPNLDLQGVQILSQTMNRNFNSSDSFLKNNIGFTSFKLDYQTALLIRGNYWILMDQALPLIQIKV
ncbi:MAG: hypothetical protein Ct9H90mP15_00380 [Candidatus Neomarinimicrobiota bacterium]|nr:MAG: hypothetical protein Ct9H90mP15_00380 [Candidatus Neomarinimicrobiota bacterium]